MVSINAAAKSSYSVWRNRGGSPRGTLMGNRGIIHDLYSKTLLRKRWTTKGWITCRLEYKGIRRAVMETRSWTELFFLLRPANYSDTDPGPKTRPNVDIRIFELSLYYAGLNR